MQKLLLTSSLTFGAFPDDPGQALRRHEVAETIRKKYLLVSEDAETF